MKIAVVVLSLVSQLFFSQKSKLNISIDERIETLYAVAHYSNYFLTSKHPSLNKMALDNDFKSLRNHRAVSLFDSLSKKYDFAFTRPVDWLLEHSNFPEFVKTKKSSDQISFVKESKEYLLDDFRLELIKFNQDSLFQNYLKKTKPINEKIISNVLKSETIRYLPDYLEEYYGTELSSYNVILSPFLHSGGYNSEMINEKGQKEVYAIIGPNGEIDFYSHFDKDFLEMDLILHEFSHSFINPIVIKYQEKLNLLERKYYNEQLKKSGKEQGYDSWKNVFIEILVRATVIRITQLNFGNEKANELLSFEKSVGFDLVEKIIDELKQYENNRKQYKNFEDFYPILIKRL
ncbi:DUF4932 domain-containing protein [Riemerella anatipestifer]|uniref:DUF4932 domain-containing protein n=1 Tax=Riemerella anatipestifer TaxID=34085 RepID=UPI000699EFA0|nr:DUF4932 domain-containing protein [Riemerella anatipestifer]